MAEDSSGFGVPTKRLALDCEFVGCGLDGEENQLARVSLVNERCECVYDKFVKPRERIVDYRTQFSGIRPELLRNGTDFRTVQQEVFNLIDNRILIGHALKNDMKVLFMDHPRRLTRDTSRYKPLCELASHRGGTPSLRLLSERILKKKIQQGEHDSVEDARAAMQLYLRVRKRWEAEMRAKFGLGALAQLKLKKKKKKKTKPSPEDEPRKDPHPFAASSSRASDDQNRFHGGIKFGTRSERKLQYQQAAKLAKSAPPAAPKSNSKPFILFHVDQLASKRKRTDAM